MANGFEQNDVFFGFTHLWSALKENDMTIGGKHKPIRGARQEIQNNNVCKVCSLVLFEKRNLNQIVLVVGSHYHLFLCPAVQLKIDGLGFLFGTVWCEKCPD